MVISSLADSILASVQLPAFSDMRIGLIPRIFRILLSILGRFPTNSRSLSTPPEIASISFRSRKRFTKSDGLAGNPSRPRRPVERTSLLPAFAGFVRHLGRAGTFRREAPVIRNATAISPLEKCKWGSTPRRRHRPRGRSWKSRFVSMPRGAFVAGRCPRRTLNQGI